jgi:hypothetical protein
MAPIKELLKNSSEMLSIGKYFALVLQEVPHYPPKVLGNGLYGNFEQILFARDW